MTVIEKLKDSSKKRRDFVIDYYLSPDSPARCDACHTPMSTLRMIAIGVFHRQQYLVKCKKCGHLNLRFK